MTAPASTVTRAVKGALATALLTTALLAAPASAETITVTMPGSYFDPARTTAVVGDVVTWRNGSGGAHTVYGPGIESGYLAPGAEYSKRFEQVGTLSYRCTLHFEMTGELDVVAATFEASADAVVAGASVELSGRVPAGSGPVTIERIRASTTEPLVTVEPTADGRFSATLTPMESSRYRAVAGSLASAPVEVRVHATETPSSPTDPGEEAHPAQPGNSPPALAPPPVAIDRAPQEAQVALRLRLKVLRGKRFDRIRVAAFPVPTASLTAVLQLYSRERFSWRRAGHERLDRAGRAEFRVRRAHRRRARVVLIARPRGPHVAVSRSVRLWRPTR